MKKYFIIGLLCITIILSICLFLFKNNQLDSAVCSVTHGNKTTNVKENNHQRKKTPLLEKNTAPGLTKFQPPVSLSKKEKFSKFFEGDLAKRPSNEQISNIIEYDKQTPGIFIAAFQFTGDKSYLDKALAKFPNEPSVIFAAALATTRLEERLTILENLKQADPDNSLPRYLLANTLVQLGRLNEAIEAIKKASLLTESNSYWSQASLALEDFYISAGNEPLVAKSAAVLGTVIPHIGELRKLSSFLALSYKQALQAGDIVLARSFAVSQRNVGKHLIDNHSLLIEHQIGISIENAALKHLVDTATDEETKLLEKSLLEYNIQLSNEIQAMLKTINSFGEIPNEDISTYFDKMRTIGGYDATLWLINQY